MAIIKNNKRRDFLSAVVTTAVSAPAMQKFASASELAESTRGQDGFDQNGPSESALANLSKEAKQIARLHSVVVSSQGKVVLSKAFHGPPLNQAVNVKSVSKSLVATLVGAAEQRGYIESVEQTLGELVPELIPKGSDPRVAKLTLEDLLTMRAGLERVSGPGYGRWVSSDNWIHYALTRPFVAEPGTRMLYSTGDTHVLGAVLTRLTDQSLYKLANEWLGKPLGIEFAPWTRDPQGYYLGGNEMSLTPEHLARVGQLYLNDGKVIGHRVLPAGWVTQAFKVQTHSPFSGDGYGYGWFERNFGGVRSAYARGYGGQVMHVVPALDLVVVITSDATKKAASNGYLTILHDLVGRHLV